MLRTALTLFLVAAPALAQVHSKDVDVFQAFGTPAASELGPETFDADWAADGRLVLAWTEAGYKGNVLVIAVHDPNPGASEPWRILGKFGAPGWTLSAPRLAVPPVHYGDPDLDRVYVALAAQAPVQGKEPYVVNVVRLVSVALDGSEGQVRVAQQVDPTSKPSSYSKAPWEIPGLALTPKSNWSNLPDYVVDFVYVEPDLGVGILLARSFDSGRNLSAGCPIVGPHAKLEIGGAPADYLRNVEVAELALAGDGVSRRTFILLASPQRGSVVLLSSPYPKKPGEPIAVDLEWESTNPNGPESRPRIACNLEGTYAFTILTPSANHADGSDVRWFTGNHYAGAQEMKTLPDRVWGPADIDLRGNDARIAANALVDGGKAAAPAFYEASVNDPVSTPVGVPVADEGKAFAPPVAAASPKGTPGHRATIFRSRASEDAGDPWTIWMDE